MQNDSFKKPTIHTHVHITLTRHRYNIACILKYVNTDVNSMRSHYFLALLKKQCLSVITVSAVGNKFKASHLPQHFVVSGNLKHLWFSKTQTRKWIILSFQDYKILVSIVSYLNFQCNCIYIWNAETVVEIFKIPVQVIFKD